MKRIFLKIYGIACIGIDLLIIISTFTLDFHMGNNNLYYYGTLFSLNLIYGIMIEFILILISSIYAFNYNTNTSLLFGFIASIFSSSMMIYTITSTIIHSFFDLYVIISFFPIPFLIGCNLLLLNIKRKINDKEIVKIKNILLEYGSKFARSQIRDISEKSDSDKSLIIRVAISMIENKEIYARYFKSTNTIAFNQDANIAEIDDLMAKFKEWEAEGTTKI